MAIPLALAFSATLKNSSKVVGASAPRLERTVLLYQKILDLWMLTGTAHWWPSEDEMSSTPCGMVVFQPSL